MVFSFEVLMLSCLGTYLFGILSGWKIRNYFNRILKKF